MCLCVRAKLLNQITLGLATLSILTTSFYVPGCGPSSPSGPTTATSPAPWERGSESDAILDEDIRERLWDIEHLGFVLEATVFPKLKSTFNDGSLEFWKKIVSKDVQSGIPRERPPETRVADGRATTASTRYTDAQLSDTGFTEFVEWLAGVRSRFNNCKSSLGLVRLTPCTESLAENFTAVWRLRIAGNDADGPAETEMEFHLTFSELSDLISEKENWVTSFKVTREVVLNSKQDFFKETTDLSGLGNARRYDNWTSDRFVPNTGGVYVSDYDLDGHLDVFLDDQTDENRLYRGRGDGTFLDVTKESGIEFGIRQRNWTLSCWADLDNDGDDDLIAEDRLYENLGNGSFLDVTDRSNLPLTPSVSYAVADYDSDGLLDLYVCHTSAYRVGQPQRTRVKWIDDGLGIDNALMRNLGDWQFEDVTAKANAGANGSSCFAAVWLYANDDNLIDLFAINEFGVNSLLLNSESGTFTNTAIDPVFGGFSMGTTAGDFNNDGRTDLYVANMYSKAGNRILANVDRTRYPDELYRKIEAGTRGSKLYAGNRDGSFTIVPEDDMYAHVGWAYGPTFADFDNDGWLDIYGTAGFKSEARGKPDG